MRIERLRCLTLSLLSAGELSAPALRAGLAAAGESLSPLAFDGMMVAFEIRGVVQGRYAPEADYDSAGSRIYRIAADGTGQSEMPAAA